MNESLDHSFWNFENAIFQLQLGFNTESINTRYIISQDLRCKSMLEKFIDNDQEQTYVDKIHVI